ncbi:hypothetical protein JCM5296_004700 [Sporobolomyces johnsonii]
MLSSLFTWFTSSSQPSELASSSPSTPTSASFSESDPSSAALASASQSAASPSASASDSTPTTRSASHTERNRKKRAQKKKAKDRRRSTMLGGAGDGNETDDFPDADDDLSYLPTEPDALDLFPAPAPAPAPASSNAAAAAAAVAPSEALGPSDVSPQALALALSRLPPVPSGQRIKSDARTRRVVEQQGFVPITDANGDLHVGVRVKEDVVAVLGPENQPILFRM